MKNLFYGIVFVLLMSLPSDAKQNSYAVKDSTSASRGSIFTIFFRGDRHANKMNNEKMFYNRMGKNHYNNYKKGESKNERTKSF